MQKRWHIYASDWAVWHLICGYYFCRWEKNQRNWMKVSCVPIQFKENWRHFHTSTHMCIDDIHIIFVERIRVDCLHKIMYDKARQRSTTIWGVNQGTEHVSPNTRRLNDFILGIHRKVSKTSSFIATFNSQPIYQISRGYLWQSLHLACEQWGRTSETKIGFEFH